MTEILLETQEYHPGILSTLCWVDIFGITTQLLEFQDPYSIEILLFVCSYQSSRVRCF